MKGRGSLRAASATASLPGQVLARRLFARAAASKAKQEWSSPLSRCYIRVPQRDGRQGLAKQQRPAHAGARVLPDCTAAAGRRTFGESVRGREEERRPPELITESGAPAVRRRVMVNDRPGTDPKRSRQIGRSRGHATRRLPWAAVCGGRTPFFQGGAAAEGARSRERGARRAAAHIRVPRAFAAACAPACHCKREARTRLLLQR